MKRMIFSFNLLAFALLSCLAQPKASTLMDAHGQLWSHKYSEAVNSFTRLINSTTSPDPSLFLYRGMANFYSDKLPEAKVDFEKTRQLGDVEGQLWLARVNVLNGETQHALANLNHYFKVNGDLNYADIRSDSLFRPLHQLDGWVSLWQIDRMTEEVKIADELQYYFRARDFEGAHLLISDAMSQGLDQAKLYALNAMIYKRENNLQLAVYEINNSLELEQKSLQYLVMKLSYLEALNRSEEVFEVLSELMEINSNNLEYPYKRAQYALEIGELETSMRDIELCMNYNKEAEVVFLAGKINFASGKYLDALRIFNPLLESDSTNVHYLLARGKTFYQTRTYKSAANDLSMSLDLDPKHAEANYYMALAEKAMGNYDMACYYFERARKFGDPNAQDMMNKNCLE